MNVETRKPISRKRVERLETLATSRDSFGNPQTHGKREKETKKQDKVTKQRKERR